MKRSIYIKNKPHEKLSAFDGLFPPQNHLPLTNHPSDILNTGLKVLIYEQKVANPDPGVRHYELGVSYPMSGVCYPDLGSSYFMNGFSNIEDKLSLDDLGVSNPGEEVSKRDQEQRYTKPNINMYEQNNCKS